jgi:hypothetical protein
MVTLPTTATSGVSTFTNTTGGSVTDAMIWSGSVT